MRLLNEIYVLSKVLTKQEQLFLVENFSIGFHNSIAINELPIRNHKSKNFQGIYQVYISLQITLTSKQLKKLNSNESGKQVR